MILKPLSEITKQYRERGNSGSTPYIEIGDINVNTKEYSYKDKSSLAGCLMAKKGNILISRVRPTRGATSLVKENRICVSSAFTILEPKENILLNNYLFYSLAYNKIFYNYLEKMQKGTSYPSCKEKDILNFKIPLPSLSEQKHIAEILEKADTLRKKRQEADALNNKIIQSVFFEMFGDPVRKTKNWKTVEINDIAKKEKYAIVDGPFGASLKVHEYVEKGIPVIRINNVRPEGFYNAEFKYITEEKYRKLIRSKVNKNDILIARVGNTVGKSCIFDQDFRALLSTTGVCKITCDPGIIHYKFLISQLNIPQYLEYILTKIRGGGQPYLNLTMIKDLEIILPPLLEQQKFVDLVQKVEKIKEEQQESKKELDNLFNSLMQKHFS